MIPGVNPEQLAELRRRLVDADRVDVVANLAAPGEGVISVDPSMQHVFAPASRSPEGVLAKRPVADLVGLLEHVGADATAVKIRAPAPEGYVWAVWLARGCAMAALWPLWTGPDEAASALVNAARDDIAACAAQARAQGLVFAEHLLVVGEPWRIARAVPGYEPCACVVSAVGVPRAPYVDAVRSHDAALARDLEAPVTPGHLRVMVVTPTTMTVCEIPAPRGSMRRVVAHAHGGWN